MNSNLNLRIDRNSSVTLHQQIRNQIIWLIINGNIHVSEQLPSIRVMSKQLGINLDTVRHAYQLLESEGLVETRHGLGTRVIHFNLSYLFQSVDEIRSHTVGVVLPSWDNPFYHSLLQGAEEVAKQNQTLFFLCLTHDDPLSVWRDVGSLISKGVDGLLIVSHDITSIIRSKKEVSQIYEFPIVVVDAPACKAYVVQLDLESAGYQATKHLIDQGHEHIALITYIEESHNVAPVNQGYRRALQEANIEIEPKIIKKVPGFGFPAGEQGAQELMRLPSPPTAIFAITDLMALGVMHTLKKASLRIPEDVSIVGFNNIPASEWVDPPLTTVVTPSYELGREAMKMLQQLIDGAKPNQREIILPTSLITRQSTKKPR